MRIRNSENSRAKNSIEGNLTTILSVCRSIGLITIVVLGVGLMWYILYTKIVGQKRRKRDLFRSADLEDFRENFSLFNAFLTGRHNKLCIGFTLISHPLHQNHRMKTAKKSTFSLRRFGGFSREFFAVRRISNG